jgi:hypothetical protein
MNAKTTDSIVSRVPSCRRTGAAGSCFAAFGEGAAGRLSGFGVFVFDMLRSMFAIVRGMSFGEWGASAP